MSVHSFELNTNDLPQHLRRHAVSEFLQSVGTNLECTPLQAENWRISSSVRRLPGGHFSKSITSPMRTSFSGAAHSDLLVVAAMSEAFQIERSGRRDLWGNANDLYFGSFEKHGQLSIGRPYETLAFTFDSGALAPLVRDLDTQLRCLPSQMPEAQLLTGYLRLMEQRLLGSPETLRPELEQAIAGHVRDLTALMLGARADAREMIRDGGVRAARIAAIRDHLARHFHEPDMSTEKVAAALGITARYVRRLLEENGESFSDLLSDFRMDSARRQLTAPLTSRLSITDIAERVGYTEFTTFYRHFRRRYGMSPSEMRRG